MGWSSQCYSISAGINGWKYYKTAAFLNRTATVDGLTAGKQYDYSVIYEGNIVAQGTIKPAISPIQTLELYTTNFTTIEAGGNIPLAGAVLEWTNPYGTNQNVTLTTDASIALPIGKATYTVAAAPDNYDILLNPNRTFTVTNESSYNQVELSFNLMAPATRTVRLHVITLDG